MRTLATDRDNRLCYATWNVNGLGSPAKRKKVLGSLKSNNYHVVFLQETHMSKMESEKLCRGWVGHVFFSEGSSRSKGVAILISKRVQFKCIKEISDEEGRLVIVLAEIQGQTIILANIYAPNIDDPAFFLDLENRLQGVGDFPIILGGDYNIYLDKHLDRSDSSSSLGRESMTQL